MPLVSLDLPLSDDEYRKIVVNADLRDGDLGVLSRFVAQFQRVRGCVLLQRGMPGFQGFKFGDGQVTIQSGECTDAELYELLHLLRPVTLESESASFPKVMSLLGKFIQDFEVRDFLKLCSRVYRDGEISLFFQFTVSAQPIFHESLLRNWLNGTQYHTDEEKMAVWSNLVGALGEANMRSAVISQLHGKVSALLNADYISRKLLEAHNGA